MCVIKSVYVFVVSLSNIKVGPYSLFVKNSNGQDFNRYQTFHLKLLKINKEKENNIHQWISMACDNQDQPSDQFLATNKLATNKAICIKTKKINKSNRCF